MIAIIDYKMGNLHSITNAIEFLGGTAVITNDREVILKSEKIILPGVGSFKVAMDNIRSMRLDEVLDKYALELKRPVLGICLGMQLLATSGEEDGLTKGLGWIKGQVRKFDAEAMGLPIPHIGFNTVFFCKNEEGLFSGLGEQADFYFVHSYRMICEDPGDITGSSKYGIDFTAAVRNENIFGTQFHPEKSQTNGLRVLKNFMDL